MTYIVVQFIFVVKTSNIKTLLMCLLSPFYTATTISQKVYGIQLGGPERHIDSIPFGYPVGIFQRSHHIKKNGKNLF